MPLHILYFHQHFTTPDGSGSTRSYEFARALIGAGHRVTMVCGLSSKSNLQLPPPDRRGHRRGIIDGIEVIALPLRYSNHDGVLRRTVTFLRYALASVMLALRMDYDLAFATSTPLTAAIPGIAARWLRGKPFIFEVRDLWPELPRAMGMKNPFLLAGMWLLEGLAYRSSRACIGLAPGIVEGIARRSAACHPVTMIPNGCDTTLFNPSLRGPCEAEGISPGDFVAGFTGAHGKANGLDMAVDLAIELRRRGQRDIKVLLVGEGSEKHRLVERAAKEGLDNLIFLSSMPKRRVARLTASLDCGLMMLADVPAFYRGTSPNKFFDYISSGIPVVTNYPGWIRDIIVESGAGVAVAPRDPRALADAIIRLRENPEVRALMGSAGRRLAEGPYSRETGALAFVAWIERHGRA